MSDALWQESWGRQKHRLKGRKYKALLPQLNSNLQDFNACVENLNKEYGKKNIASHMLKLKPWLNHIDSFSQGVSTMVQSNPQIAALVWGGTQILIVCASRFIRLLNLITDMLRGLARPLARIQNALEYYPTNDELMVPMRGLYDEYTSFCISAIIVLKKWPCYNLVRMSWSIVDQSFATSQGKIENYVEEFLTEWEFLYRKEQLTSARTLQDAIRHVHIVERSSKRVFGSVSPKNAYFTGRQDVLRSMNAHLQPPKTPKDVRFCVVHGIGGLGKTHTALEYTYQNRDWFDDVFWLQAETDPELAKSFGKIAQDKLPQNIAELQDQSRIIEMVRRWFDETDRKCLIVFDNAENLKNVLTYWPTNPRISVIITTQKAEFLQIGVAAARLDVPLQPLSPQEGAALLLKCLQNDTHHREYGWDDSHSDAAETISTMVAGLPLGIAHIAGYLNEARLTFNAFITVMKNRQNSSRVWSSAPSAYVWDYGKTLGEVHDLALSELGPEASTTLNVMACFNPTAFNQSFLITKPKDSDAAALATSETDFGFIEVIRSLLARRLVDQKFDGQMIKYSIHRSLQMNVLHRLDSNTRARQSAFDHALGVIRATIPDRSLIYLPAPEHWAIWDDCLPHVISLQAIFEASNPPISSSFHFATLLQGAGQYMWERSMTREGPELLKAAERILDKINMPVNDSFRADLYTPIGLMMHFNGMTSRSEGIQYLRRALTTRETNLGDTPTEEELLIYWIAKMDLGWALLQSENFDEAESIYEECLAWYQTQEMCEEKLPFQYAKYYHNSSYVLMSRGLSAEAIRRAERAVELCTLEISLTSQHGFMYRFTLGCHNLNSGRAAVALDIHQEILNDRIETLGKTNKDTLDSQYMMAVIHEDMANSVNATTYLETALKNANTAKWAPEHTARAKYRLSRLFRIKDRDMSEKLKKEAELLLETLRSAIPQDVLRSAAADDDMILYDYISSIWAGRTTGALSIGELK